MRLVFVLGVILGACPALAIDADSLGAALAASGSNACAGQAAITWRTEGKSEDGPVQEIHSTVVWNGPVFRQQDERTSSDGASLQQTRLYDGRRAVDVTYGGMTPYVLVQEISRPYPNVQQLGRLSPEESAGTTLSLVEEREDGTCVAALEKEGVTLKLWVEEASGFLVSRKEIWLASWSSAFPLRVITASDLGVDSSGVWYPKAFVDETYGIAEDGTSEVAMRISGSVTAFSSAGSLEIDRGLTIPMGAIVTDARVKPGGVWRIQSWW